MKKPMNIKAPQSAAPLKRINAVNGVLVDVFTFTFKIQAFDQLK